MLAVKSVLYDLTLFIEIVQDSVGVGLLSGSEDRNFIELSEVLQTGFEVGSHLYRYLNLLLPCGIGNIYYRITIVCGFHPWCGQELGMDKCLIHIKDESLQSLRWPELHKGDLRLKLFKCGAFEMRANFHQIYHVFINEVINLWSCGLPASRLSSQDLFVHLLLILL